MSAPFISADKTAQVTMQYTNGGQIAENVYWVLGTAEWDVTSLTALIAQFVTWESADASPDRSNFVGLRNIHARDWSQQNGPEVDASQSIDGALTAEPMPQNVTVAVKAQTGIAGRSFRGRTFWLGLTVAQQSAVMGVLNTSAAAAIITIMNQLRSTAFTNSGKLVVASFRHNNLPRAAAVLTPILSYTMSDQTMDSQRRRLPGHNRHR